MLSETRLPFERNDEHAQADETHHDTQTHSHRNGHHQADRKLGARRHNFRRKSGRRDVTAVASLVLPVTVVAADERPALVAEVAAHAQQVSVT